MKLNEIYALLDAAAPRALSEEYCAKYGAYDNSGVLIDTGADIGKILFSLDLSAAAVREAEKAGANLIVTHHPAIYSRIGNIRVGDPLGAKLAACLKNGISVVSMHLNLDAAAGGIDDCLMQGVRGATGASGTAKPAVMQPLGGEGCGYGRAYGVRELPLSAFAEAVKTGLGARRVEVYGRAERKICRAASFCGAGAGEDSLEFALREGADVVVSSDFKHHILTLASETGLAVVQLTHYASENYGFEKYYRKIRGQAGVPCVFHTDEELL